MKTKIFRIALSNLIVGIFISTSCYTQKWGGDSHPVILTKWSVNINGGLASYFGDLSLSDADISAKLNQESGLAMSIIISKYIFRETIGISGQVITGNLEGNNGDISFTTKMFEYNIHARIDFVDLFMLDTYHAFGVVGYAGAGQFYYSTTKVVMNEGPYKNFEQDAAKPEFVYFFGGGIYYKLNSNFGVTADLALRRCQTDRLDDYVKNNDYDFYTYISVGVSYYINTFKGGPLRNKSRLANSSFLFKTPASTALR
jgi:hypothetical protein